MASYGKQSDLRTCQYTRRQLLSLRHEKFQINNNNKTQNFYLPRTIYHKIRELKIACKPRTRRGCRSGKNNNKRAHAYGENTCTTDQNTCTTDQPRYNTFKVGYMNAQSCRNKAEELSDLIDDFKIDILFITETWLRPNDDATIACLTPPNYTVKSCPRHSRRGGGIAIIYRTSLESKISVKPEPSFEHTTFEIIELTVDFGSKFLNFVCLYRPPSSKVNQTTLTTFTKEIREMFSLMRTKKGIPIILGDFNVHYDSNKSEVKKIKEILTIADMIQLIDSPTHNKNHIIDWVITRKSDNIIQNIRVLEKLISDHHVLLFEVMINKPKSVTQSIMSRNIKSINQAEFKLDISNGLQHLQSCSVEDLNDCLRKVLNHHAPLTARRISKRPYSPWFSENIKLAKSECRKAERIWQKSGLTVHKLIYRQKRNVWKEKIRKAKKEHYLRKFQNTNSCKQLFGLCDELLGRTKRIALPKTYEMSKLPNIFASYFLDKIEKIRTDLDVHGEPDYFHEYLGTTLDHFYPVSETEVKRIILRAPRKSCELDPIPSSVLQICIDEIVPPLTKIINVSLINGNVPVQFREALVKPLLKKKTLDQDILKNYRPVSNLPYFSKILEKVVLQQLLSHLQNNNLLEPFQSAYRANHSTETALLRVINDLLTEADEGKVTLLSLLDLSAAFDTIDHDILLKRLELTFGIKGSALKWFDSYLIGRRQTVVVDGVKSECHTLKYGVPQGSVLGPVLFTIYTQPLAKEIGKFQLRHHFYADDTQLYGSSMPCDVDKLLVEFEGCIVHVKQWMNKNKLALNEEKTEIILTGSANNRRRVKETRIKIGNISIDFSSTAKNLGILFDSNLSMTSAINQLARKMYFELYNISKIRHLIPTKVASVLVNSLVVSKLDYCNSLLSGVSQENIKKLQLAQNNAARVVLKKGKREHATPLLQSLHWLPVEKRILYKLATLCHKCMYQSAPPYVTELLTPYEPSRKLRSSSDKTKLKIPNMRLKTMGERSFSYAGPKFWNTLPQNIRQIECPKNFRNKLKTFLFITTK